MTKIILASSSPRRKELLKKTGLEFSVVPSNFNEYLDDNRDPSIVAVELAIGKASTVAKTHPNDIVIGSDTIVTVSGQQLAKAADDNEARQMLTMLSGKRNYVTTSLVVMKLSDGVQLTGSDTASVDFLPYNEEKVSQYIKTGDYKDKAGAYGIQSGAAPLIKHFSGNYDTILGLPTKLLSEFLSQLDIKIEPIELPAPVKQVNNV